MAERREREARERRGDELPDVGAHASPPEPVAPIVDEPSALGLGKVDRRLVVARLHRRRELLQGAMLLELEERQARLIARGRVRPNAVNERRAEVQHRGDGVGGGGRGRTGGAGELLEGAHLSALRGGLRAPLGRRLGLAPVRGRVYALRRLGGRRSALYGGIGGALEASGSL